MEQRIVNFDQNHGHTFQKINSWKLLNNINTHELCLEECQKLICEIINLNNKLLASGSFLGLIQIWNPLNGICILRINTLENHFISTNINHPQILKMCQISDNLIALTHYQVQCDGANKRIYIINIMTSGLQILDNYDLLPRYTQDIFSITRDSFVTVGEGMISTWYINEDDEVLFISKKIKFDSKSFILNIEENKMIVLDTIMDAHHVIKSINTKTNDEINLSLEHGEKFIFRIKTKTK